jgi:hypothetical protein
VYIFASLIAPSLALVPLAQKKLYLISPGVIRASRQASTPPAGRSALAGHRRPVELGLDRIDDLQVRPAQAQQAITSQAVNVFSPEDIPEQRSTAAPLCGGPVPAGHRFAVFQPAFVEMLSAKLRLDSSMIRFPLPRLPGCG